MIGFSWRKVIGGVWFCVLLLVSSVSAQGETVRVGIYDNLPKVGLDEAGKPIGFFPTILNHIAEKENWTLDYVHCVWEKCLSMVEAGELDIMMDVAYSEGRTERLKFNTDAVLLNWSRVYGPRNTEIDTILDLDGKRIGVLQGSFQARRLAEHVDSFGITPTLVEFTDLAEIFQAIASRSIDAGIANRLFGERNLKKYGVEETAVILFPSRLHFVSPYSATSGFLERIDSHLIALKQDKGSIYYTALNDLLTPVRLDDGTGLQLTEEERAWLARHPVIRVAGDRAWPPIEFVAPDGSFHGISVDYLKVLSEKLGVRFEFDPDSDWNTVVEKLKNRQLDMFAAAAETEQRRAFAIFTKPHLSLSNAVFTRNDATFLSDLSQLTGKKVSAVRGYAIAEYLKSAHPGLDLVEVVDIPTGLRKLADGEVEAHIGAVITTGYYIRRDRFDTLKISGTVPYALEVSMATRNDWPILAGILQKALDSISDQTKSDIHQKWIGLQIEREPDYTIFWRWAALAIGLILVFLVWNAFLQRRNAAQKRELEAVNRALRREVEVRTTAEMRAVAANAAKSEFLARMSHDLRTPLNAIQGFSEMLAKKMYGPSRDPQEYATIITRSAQTLTNMVNDILDLSKIESGEYTINEREVDVVQEIARSSERLLCTRTQDYTDFVAIDAADDAPALLADQRAVSQILDNLLDNAIKYSEGDPELKVSWRIAGDGGGLLSVSDKGIGINPDFRDEILKPFVRAVDRIPNPPGFSPDYPPNFSTNSSPNFSRAHEGIGLGLHIVSKLVEMHQGRLEIESEFGSGTTVTVWFPPARVLTKQAA